MADLIENLRAGIPDNLEAWLVAALAAGLGVVLALIVHQIVFTVLRKVASSSESKADNIVVRHLARPSKWAPWWRWESSSPRAR